MFVQLFVVFLSILLSVAFFSLLERKVMGFCQVRKGPAKVGFLGFLQPFSDAIKLVLKQESSPFSSVKVVYFFSPLLFFGVSMVSWVTFPSEWVLFNLSDGILFVLFCFCLSSYGVIFSGWFSNSKYATLGCGRILTQSVSYEIGMASGVILLCSFFCFASLEEFLWLQSDVIILFGFFFVYVLLFVSFLAELNRSPFDLAEGESELVSGYSVEYGGLSYTLLFLSENSSLIWSSFFLGVIFSKMLVLFNVVLLIFVRASLPRVRFDVMMLVFWSWILPLILFFFTLVFSVW